MFGLVFAIIVVLVIFVVQVITAVKQMPADKEA